MCEDLAESLRQARREVIRLEALLKEHKETENKREFNNPDKHDSGIFIVHNENQRYVIFKNEYIHNNINHINKSYPCLVEGLYNSGVVDHQNFIPKFTNHKRLNKDQVTRLKQFIFKMADE